MFGYRILGLGGSHPNRGGDSRVTITLTIGSNTTNYNIYNNRGGTYAAGTSDITLVNNATISSTSVGTAALDTGTGWTSGDTVTIDNNSIVVGDGGDGGRGEGRNSNTATPSSLAGGAAGHAINMQIDTTIDNTGGTISGGGGGGGGGASTSTVQAVKGGSNIVAYGGGGGGGGAGGGAGGAAGPAVNGNSGNVAGSAGAAGNVGGPSAGAGGAGGGSSQAGAGGNGGAVGAAGSAGVGATNGSAAAGGAAGKAVNLNSNSITWTANGTRNGAIS